MELFKCLTILILLVMVGCASSKSTGREKSELAVVPDVSMPSKSELPKNYKAQSVEDDEVRMMAAIPKHWTPASPQVAVSAPPVPSGLKAGYADDNKQFNYFLSFLDQYKAQSPHYPIQIQERIILKVKDKDGKPISNADVQISGGGKNLCSGRTYADGSFLFFPSEYDSSITSYKLVVENLQDTTEMSLDRQGVREIAVVMGANRVVADRITLDILFILDTTGSMGKEIQRLKNTIETINLNLAALTTKTNIRFGMVLYRDRKDEYVTKVIPLTTDLDAFRAELEKVRASGGGDEPEDLQSALSDSIKKIQWNQDGIRLAYVVTDASAHLNYGQTYTYHNAVQDARRLGIKIFTVGTGGLNIKGEYVLRQISQYTAAKYIFLTYGERGESEGGKEGSVSHHTGDNFQTDKLESIIIRFAKEELSWQSDKPLTDSESYLEAIKLSGENREDTLQKAFDMAISEMIDYSSIGIKKGTQAAVIPFSTDQDGAKANAEYFTEQFGFSLAKNKTFRIVERKEMQKIFDELKIQHSGLVADDKVAKMGQLMGAKMIITGKLYDKGDRFEIFLKLIRVETGEILAVNKLKLESQLGIVN